MILAPVARCGQPRKKKLRDRQARRTAPRRRRSDASICRSITSAICRAAIDAARQVPELPFGAVLVDSRSGEIVARGHNRSGENPTFHGEIDVINRLAARAGRGEIDWSALVLYTTAEPCPMCQGAIEWAGIGNVVYGTSIETLQRLGWWQIDIRADEVIRRTPFRETRITGGVLEADCDALFVAVPKEQVPE